MSVAGDDVRLGVVLLCHSQLDMAQRMAQIWAEGGAEVAVHVDLKADPNGFEKMHETLASYPNIRFSPRRTCNWGRFDLVQATQDAASQLLKDAPHVSHVLLASGSCLPLRPVNELTEYLGRDPKRDFIESVAVNDVFWAMGGLNEERFTRYFPFDWRHQRGLFERSLKLQRRFGITRTLPKQLVPHLGSQWWCLTRETLSAILNNSRRVEFDRFFRLSWIPDESYFQSLARLYSRRLESRSLTLARFDHQGKPYMLYDDHQLLLEESGCFVARKVWSGAQSLLSHFPRQNASIREPDPSRIERLFNKATERRTLGRPGLYMQSRFPRLYSEYGKSAAPYTVLQGFSELIPGFEDWLASHTKADVHGHLFAPDRVEYAGQNTHGPGALSDNPKLRDYDPERFLTSLLRLSGRMQVFQYGPGDNQSLNWFMVTDPNARFRVITGAWVVPLLHSELPFDRIRQIAAHMQRIETDQFKALQSPWLRARAQIWDLAEFAAEPKKVLSSTLACLDPALGMVDDLPPMHDLSRVGPFLQQLRNAGLRPSLTGHFPPTDDAPTEKRPAP